MKNNKHTITPSEINKFLYCPYQWYYERYYGTKTLRELHKLRNEKYNLKDTRAGNFSKGLNYHETYLYKEKTKNRIAAVLVAAAVLVIFMFIKSNGF